jgi:hypothetical protein
MHNTLIIRAINPNIRTTLSTVLALRGIVHARRINHFQQLQRPRLLMRAASISAMVYRRTKHLPRLLNYGQMPKHPKAILRLNEIKGALNALRKTEESACNLLNHIDVIIATVGETRDLRLSTKTYQLTT